MSESSLTDLELTAYLDEMLPLEHLASFEAELRASESLRRRLSAIARRRDQGLHSVGEIWRRNGLSCPTRHQLGSYLLGTIEPEMSKYVDFHLRTIGCRVCVANLDDLEKSMESNSETTDRRRRFFQSSAGYLPK